MITFSRSEAYRMPDPALQTLWYLTTPSSNGAAISIAAESVSATWLKTSFRPRPADGKKLYFPDQTDIDGLNIVFYETFDFRVTRWYNSFQELVFNDGFYGMPANYKKPFILSLFERSNTKTPIYTITYEGCAPTDRAPFNLNYEDETGRITVEAQFTVDNVVEEAA